ncbi:MAG: hypothetical protein WC668_01265, partial [Patescibacteria group bacterium]
MRKHFGMVTKTHQRYFNRLIIRVIMACFAVLSLFFVVTQANASFNQQINYQGKLTDHSDVPVADGDYDMVFRLCADSACSSVLWTETRTGADQVAVANGLFSVMLGSVTSLLTVDFNQDMYLEVAVSGETLTPRKRLGAVPNALNALEFDGLATTSFLRADIANDRATITNLTSTNFFADNASITNATSTNFFAAALSAVSSVISNLTATVANISTLVFGDATGSTLAVTDLSVTSTANIKTLNASSTLATNSTSTNLFSTYASVTQATTTNLYTSVFNAISGLFTNLVATIASITDLTATRVTSTESLVSQGVTTLATTTVSGDLSIAGSTTSTVSSYLGTSAGLNGVYINDWSDISTLAGSWSTSSSDYWKSVNNFFSTTSADYWDTTKDRWTSANATTSFNFLITPYSTQAYNSSTFFTLVGWYETSSQYLTTTTAAATYLSLTDWYATTTWSTTSADYWETQQTRWTTTSEQYFWNTTTTWAGFESNFDTYYSSAVAKNPFNQWLDTTNTPTFAGLTLSGNLSVTGTSTLATTTINRLLSGDQTLVGAGSVFGASALYNLSPSIFGGITGFINTIGASNWLDLGGGISVGEGSVYSSVNVNSSSTNDTSIYYGNNWETTYANTSGFYVADANRFRTVFGVGSNITTNSYLDNANFELENDGTVTGNLVNVNIISTNDGGTINGDYTALKIGDVLSMGATNNYAIYSQNGKNYFGGDLQVAGVATTSNLVIGSLNGLLQATDGLVSATSSPYFSGNLTIGSLNGVLQATNGSVGVTSSPYFYSLKVATSTLLNSTLSYTTTSLPVMGGGASIARVYGNYLYVVMQTSTPTERLKIYDITKKDSPLLINSGFNLNPNSIFGARCIDIDGKYAYIGFENYSASDYSLEILDISDPYNIKVVNEGGTSITGSVRDLKVVDGLLYASIYASYTIGEDGVQIFDVSNPYSISKVSNSITGFVGETRGIDIQGKYAYTMSYVATSTNTFRILNILDSVNPTVVGGTGLADMPPWGRSVIVRGAYAYTISDGYGEPGVSSTQVFRIIDVSNPISPVIVSGWQISFTESGGNAGATGLKIQGDFAYIVDEAGLSLKIVDISDPYNPFVVDNLVLPEFLWSVDVSGDMAYLPASHTTDNQLFSVKLPGVNTPTARIGSLVSGGLQVLSDLIVQGLGKFFGLIIGDGGLKVSGRSDLATTTVNGNFSVTGSATSTVSSYLGTSAGLNGVYINNWSDIFTLAGSWSTTSEQYFWNTTTTWAGFESNFNNYYSLATANNPFNQWLDTTNTPTFAGLTLNGDLSVAGTSTLATTTMAYDSFIGSGAEGMKVEQLNVSGGTLNGPIPMIRFSSPNAWASNIGGFYDNLTLLEESG